MLFILFIILSYFHFAAGWRALLLPWTCPGAARFLGRSVHLPRPAVSLALRGNSIHANIKSSIKEKKFVVYKVTETMNPEGGGANTDLGVL